MKLLALVHILRDRRWFSWAADIPNVKYFYLQLRSLAGVFDWIVQLGIEGEACVLLKIKNGVCFASARDTISMEGNDYIILSTEKSPKQRKNQKNVKRHFAVGYESQGVFWGNVLNFFFCVKKTLQGKVTIEKKFIPSVEKGSIWVLVCQVLVC